GRRRRWSRGGPPARGPWPRWPGPRRRPRPPGWRPVRSPVPPRLERFADPAELGRDPLDQRGRPVQFACTAEVLESATEVRQVRSPEARRRRFQGVGVTAYLGGPIRLHVASQRRKDALGTFQER